MNPSTTSCKGCSMTIESGDYCQYCASEDGKLIPFDECLERFEQWTRRQEPGLSADDVRRKTVDFMATMPAWTEHPDLMREIESRDAQGGAA